MHKTISRLRHFIIVKKHKNLVYLDKLLENPNAVCYLMMMADGKVKHKKSEILPYIHHA